MSNTRVPFTEFCVKLSALPLTNTEKALAITYYIQELEKGLAPTAGELAKYIRESGLGNPNSTKLATSLKKTGDALISGNKIRIKPTSIQKIQGSISKVLEPQAPKVPQSSEFLSSQVWNPSRGYIEKVASQINGTYHSTYYDACSVLCRKLVEILIIEAFEYQNKESTIKDGNGDYFMLSRLIDSTLGANGISIGRESKKVLKEVKQIGDRSAHNRSYIAVKNDLDGIRSGLRVLVDELLHSAGIK